MENLTEHAQVSYRNLSRALSVHNNLAKQYAFRMLYVTYTHNLALGCFLNFNVLRTRRNITVSMQPTSSAVVARWRSQS